MPIFFFVLLAFLHVAALSILARSINSILDSMDSARWPAVFGKIEASELVADKGSDGDTYRVKVRYSYNVAGKEYAGDRLAFGYLGCSNKELHEAILAKMQNAKEVRVRYSPQKPSESTLSCGMHRSLQLELLLGIGAELFVLIFTMLSWVAFQNENVLLRNLVVR